MPRPQKIVKAYEGIKRCKDGTRKDKTGETGKREYMEERGREEGKMRGKKRRGEERRE